MTTFDKLPALSAQQFQHLYSQMQQRGISATQQIELAGKRVAAMAALLLTDDDATMQVDSLSDAVADRSIVVLTGPGETGAAGLMAACQLDEADAWVQVLTLLPPADHSGQAAVALNTLLAADVPLIWADDGWELPPCDLLIDALSGVDAMPVDSADQYNATARPLIELTNSSLAPILSISVPSSVDTGNAGKLFVRASATLALGLPHSALQDPAVRAVAGELYLADTNIPPSLIHSMDLDPTVELAKLFSKNSIIALSTI